MNREDHVKQFESRRYHLPKDIIKNYNGIISGNDFHDQAIDSDIKSYEKITKLTTRQVEDYTTGCFLNYEYLKNHSILIAVDLCR